MTEAEFWDLIERKVERQSNALDITALEDALRRQSPERIAAFGHHLDRLHQLSYRNRLWGAAYLINGGCSDDGFDYFRGWLIGMGRQVFNAALEDPDTLAEVAEEDVECEDILSVAHRAYEEATGDGLAPGSQFESPVADLEEWDFDDDDEMRTRYPRLYARFGC
jgi:hypothetical protein